MVRWCGPPVRFEGVAVPVLPMVAHGQLGWRRRSSVCFLSGASGERMTAAGMPQSGVGRRLCFDAREKISHWREGYNGERPHSSLGYYTPDEFADR